MKFFQALLQYDFRLASLFGAPKWHTVSGNAWRLYQEGRFWGFMMYLIDPVAWLIYQVLGVGGVPHCKWAYEKEVAAHWGNAGAQSE